MQNSFLRDLLKSDSIYIASNITFENLDGGKLIGVIKTILNKIQWAEKIVIKIRDHVFKNLLNENSFFYGLVMDKPYRIRIS